MKKLVWFILAIAICAQAQTVTVTSSHLSDSSQTPLNGTVYFQPTLLNGTPTWYRMPGGGTVQDVAVPATVVNGAFSIVLPDTTQTYPANICFKMTWSGGTISGYNCLQPHTTAYNAADWCQAGVCNLDNYLPGNQPLPTQNAVGSINYTAGNITFTGSGVSQNGNTFTFTTGGSTGTVTSVGLSLPSDFTVSGSPVTTSGTLTAIRASQLANLFLASPNGASGVPSYRAIVPADIPTLNQNTTGTASNITGTSNATLTTLSALSLPYVQLTGTPSIPTSANWPNAGTCTSGQYVDALTNGTTPTCAQVSYSQLGGTPVLPATIAVAAHEWLNSYTSTTGLFTQSQPTYADLGGTVPTWNQNTTGTAANITATTNSTLTTLSALALPYSQLTGVPVLATQSGVQQSAYTYAADTGTANAYAVTLSPAPTIVAGSIVRFKATNANTGASTLAVNGAAAVALDKKGASALVSGDILAGAVYEAQYDGTEYQILNPSNFGSGTGTVTSFSAPSASWPSWLVPTVATATTTPSLTVAASAIPYSAFTALAANQVLGALTATTPSGLTLPSCSGASNALIYTLGTGFGCNTISGSGTVNSGTANQFAFYSATGTAVSGNTHLTDNGTIIASTEQITAPSIALGSSPPSVTWGTGGGYAEGEGTAPSAGVPALNVDACYADSTAHAFKCSLNNGAFFTSAMNLPYTGAGAAIPTGPTTSTSGDVVTYTGTAGQISDSGTLLSALVKDGVGTTTANKVAVSTGTAHTQAYIDFPMLYDVPAANCNNATAGTGWSLPTSAAPTVACRTGTNVQAGVLQFADGNSAQFNVALPGDYDSAGTVYARIRFTQGTNTTSGQTIIMQMATGCSTTIDDPTFNTAQSFGTATTTTTANTPFDETLSTVTMTGCTAGHTMNVKISRTTDTATVAPNVYFVTLTIPRLLVNQAN